MSEDISSHENGIESRPEKVKQNRKKKFCETGDVINEDSLTKQKLVHEKRKNENEENKLSWGKENWGTSLKKTKRKSEICEKPIKTPNSKRIEKIECSLMSVFS